MILIIVCIFLGFYYLYKFKSYKSKIESIKEYLSPYLLTKKVEISKIDESTILFKSENNNKSALIFYPGAFVEYTAYKPLLAAIANRGINCFLLKMPLNFPLFNINAANKIKKKFSKIKNWYIGGHSLGAVSASFHLNFNLTGFKGAIFLSSYSLMDFSKSDVRILSIFGTEDKIINLKYYRAFKNKYRKNFKEIIIKGGNHSYFGMYGTMKKDGIPKITNIEQIDFTANEITNFILEN